MKLPDSRQNTIQSLATAPLDLLIIGGGIVGSGVARDAAMRGLKVGLIEQHDFAFGTSSRSSRLLHGGLRYLAQGRVGLVHEASVEKKTIHKIAPHLADPLAFVFPTYQDNKDWKLWQLKIGVKIYDLLCGGRNLGNSTWLNRAEALKHVTGLRAENLNGAVRYYDGLTNDARLVLDTLRSAGKHGATLANYTQFTKAEFVNGQWECSAVDRLTGQAFKIAARSVVNATGPWADGLQHSQVKLRLTKGIHLVVDAARLRVPDAIVMSEGKRILFVIPWGERTVIGTTDTDYNGSLDSVLADSKDITYVLKVANEFFPQAKLADGDVISSWAGLRPLIADPNGKPSDISRSHQIKMPEPFWWDVAGGKLTTYRLMAEQTVDAIAKKLGGSFAACETATKPLLNGEVKEGFSGIVPPKFGRAAVEHYCTKEWAIHLDDVMVRRTSWHYYHRDADAKAGQVADWMSELLGWSSAQKTEEVARYQKAVKG